jgi:hypothetical protein
MNKIRGLVVAVLLGVWTFPAVSSAKTPSDPAPISAPASTPTSAAQSAEGAGAASNLGAREQQSRNLQDFKGGSVAIYASSGAVLVAVIILLILLV